MELMGVFWSGVIRLGVEGPGGCDLSGVECTPGVLVSCAQLCCLYKIGGGTYGVCVWL